MFQTTSQYRIHSWLLPNLCKGIVAPCWLSRAPSSVSNTQLYTYIYIYMDIVNNMYISYNMQYNEYIYIYIYTVNICICIWWNTKYNIILCHSKIQVRKKTPRPSQATLTPSTLGALPWDFRRLHFHKHQKSNRHLAIKSNRHTSMVYITYGICVF